MTLNPIRIIVLSLLTLGLPASVAAERPSEEEIGAIQVYLTAEEAIEEVFDDACMTDTLMAILTGEEAGALRAGLGFTPPTDTVAVVRVRDSTGALLGYAAVAEEVGKYRPITFLVGATPDRKVCGVEVLVYRESRGGEIRRHRFLRQYRGKKADDPIRINRDILNVAGATLSVNAMNRGVKRVLLTLDALAARGDL